MGRWQDFGGRGYLPGGWDIVIVALIGLAFYFWGVRSAWRNPTLLEAERELVATPADATGEAGRGGEGGEGGDGDRVKAEVGV
ncbi:hypothetical protein [Streptomyces antioxidans]|uniref:hypothetical protein n=1 Tax=Streptomyces TaxID=1883 RepID=UPI00061450E3|nr:hypothetical protein [Streptomyces antioxidans]